MANRLSVGISICHFIYFFVMKENVIIDKTYKFAVRIVRLNQYLCREHKEFNLSKQIVKSGTSIGANTEEANSGQSKKDFISKLSIALKESKETHYWLRLLHDTDYISKQMFDSLIHDCEEIIMITNRILITSRKNLNDENEAKKKDRRKKEDNEEMKE